MPKWEPTTRPWIVCAANKYDDLIIAGARHHDKVMNDVIKELGGIKKLYESCTSEPEQGFIDQFGRFYNRFEAMQLAVQNGQLENQRNGEDCDYLIGTIMCSEDLY